MATKILVADGEKQIRELIKTIIGEAQPDVVVIEAQNGVEAQATFSTPGAEIMAVITGFDFGNGMTGLELIAWLRHNHLKIPILLFTSHELPGHADEFLLKPIDVSDLNRVIKRFL